MLTSQTGACLWTGLLQVVSIADHAHCFVDQLKQSLAAACLSSLAFAADIDAAAAVSSCSWLTETWKRAIA